MEELCNLVINSKSPLPKVACALGGGGNSSPPPVETPPDTSGRDQAMMQAMMDQQQEMMMAMMGSMAGAQLPPIPALPPIEEVEPIDFTEEEGIIEQRIKGNRSVALARKYGRSDTVHAPLLLDEPETTTSGVLLG